MGDPGKGNETDSNLPRIPHFFGSANYLVSNSKMSLSPQEHIFSASKGQPSGHSQDTANLEPQDNATDWCSSAHAEVSLRMRSDSAGFKLARHEEDRADTNLCENCRLIDLDAIFALPGCTMGAKGLAICDLPYLFPGKEVPSTRCALCELYRSVLQGPTKKGCYLQACDVFQVLGVEQSTQSAHVKSSGVLIVVAGRSAYGFNRYEQYKNVLAALCGGVITSVSCSPGQTQFEADIKFTARKVSAATIPYDLLRSWIETCDRSSNDSNTAHSKCTVTAGSLGAKYVIDCQTMKVVRRNNKDPYACLSYVWGKPPIQRGQARRGDQLLVPNLPQTLQDAVQAVRKLRLQYLWVDQYCINHEDIEEESFEIQHMDDIYEGAFVTLVAVGPDAEYGLPGVSDRPRTNQPTAQYKSSTYASTMPDLPSHLQRSDWTTRGWTYQEGLLSRRCLFFTDDQVFFCCKGGTERESVDLSPSAFALGEDRSLPAVLSDVRNPRVLKGQRIASERFCKQVEDYTKMNLSYISDSHNAFRGILGRTPVYTYFGVPFRDNDRTAKPNRADGDFAKGLAWTQRTQFPRLKKQPLQPIPGLPTWAWVSACCAIDYELDNKIYQNYPRTSASFAIADNHGELVRLIEQPLVPARDFVLAESPSPVLHVFTFVIAVTARVKAFSGHRYAVFQRDGQSGPWFPDADPDITIDPGPWLNVRAGKKGLTAVFLYSFKKHNYRLNAPSEHAVWLLVEAGADRVALRRGVMTSFYEREMVLVREERQWIKIG